MRPHQCQGCFGSIAMIWNSSFRSSPIHGWSSVHSVALVSGGRRRSDLSIIQTGAQAHRVERWTRSSKVQGESRKSKRQKNHKCDNERDARNSECVRHSTDRLVHRRQSAAPSPNFSPTGPGLGVTAIASMNLRSPCH